MRPMCCPETSVRNHHYSLRNSPEERSSQLLRSERLKSLKAEEDLNIMAIKDKQAVVGGRREWRKIVLELTAALRQQAEEGEGHEYGGKRRRRSKYTYQPHANVYKTRHPTDHRSDFVARH